MEYLDYYDKFMNYIGKETRDNVHSKGLWHKTVHCWLYDSYGNVYFQIRANSQKLYTTASGHVLAGETINQAFEREIKEELGLTIKIQDAELVELNIWKMDKMKNDKLFIDRAFANVYIHKFDIQNPNFYFDTNEVLGLVKVNAKECLDVLMQQDENLKINATRIDNDKISQIAIGINDFLVQKSEIALIKYGKILQSIISQQK